MANVYKNIQAKIDQAATYVDMYETPTETTSIVKSIKLYNTHGSNLVVDIKIHDASSSTDFEWDTSWSPGTAAAARIRISDIY